MFILQQGCELLIGTPGRIKEAIENFLDSLEEIDNLETKETENITETKETENTRINYLDLCSGCGGIAVGFRNTNKYNHVEFIEIDKKCCETLIANNFPLDKVNCIDITKVDFSKSKFSLFN